jgi:pSer/pThr/pTyr-binding forkhead associated (FHA) protein
VYVSQYVDHTAEDGNGESTSAFHAAALGELDALVDAEPALREVDGMPIGSALLVVKRGPNAGARFQLDQSVTSVGRHPNSDIFLDDITASRRHTEFLRDGDGFEIVDLGSLNGTYVNGKPLHSGAALANGDQIQIGKFRFVFLNQPR